MRKRKLKSSGFPILEDAVDPECIIWENIGAKKSHHCKMWLASILLAFMFLAISFYGMHFMANKEKDRVDFVKSDCIKLDILTKKQAFDDLKVKNK